MRAWAAGGARPLATAVGVLLAILIDRLTEYFTGTHSTPGQGDQERPPTPARPRLILPGVAVGFESSRVGDPGHRR